MNATNDRHPVPDAAPKHAVGCTQQTPNASRIAAVTHPASLDGRTFAIGVLAVTACILFVGLLLLLNAPAPALAAGQNDRGGDYIMITQQLSESTEGLLVIDAAAKTGQLYYYDYNKRSVELLSPKLRLDKLPGDAQNGQKGAPKKRGG